MFSINLKYFQLKFADISGSYTIFNIFHNLIIKNLDFGSLN